MRYCGYETAELHLYSDRINFSMAKKICFSFFLFLLTGFVFSPKLLARVRLIDVRYHSEFDKTRIVLEVEKISRYSAKKASSDTLSLNISELRNPLNKNSWKINDDLARSVSYSRSQIIIKLTKNVGRHHIFSLRDPARIVVDLFKKTSEQDTEQPFPVFLKTVVIDAGHGGKDAGAIGPTGLMEKAVTLDMAERVKGLLERRGIRVILTRDRDEFISLQRRVDIANNCETDLFLSIHCNAALSSKAQGFESYFLSPATDDLARAVEAVENSVIMFEPDSSNKNKEFLTLLADLKYTEYRKESKMFAEMIQSDLDRTLSTPNRGVKSALFYVLKGLEAPAVLAELGFISNPYEEKLLRSPNHRQLLAENLVTSILQFKKEFDMSAGFTK